MVFSRFLAFALVLPLWSCELSDGGSSSDKPTSDPAPTANDKDPPPVFNADGLSLNVIQARQAGKGSTTLQLLIVLANQEGQPAVYLNPLLFQVRTADGVLTPAAPQKSSYDLPSVQTEDGQIPEFEARWWIDAAEELDAVKSLAAGYSHRFRVEFDVAGSEARELVYTTPTTDKTSRMRSVSAGIKLEPAECGGTTYLDKDTSYCGTCDVRLIPGATCDGKALKCDEGLTMCGGSCRDLTNDVENCGQCGRDLRNIDLPDSTLSCDNGRPTCSSYIRGIPGPFTPFDDPASGRWSCTRTESDPLNCGTIGHSCLADAPAGKLNQCVMGLCSGEFAVPFVSATEKIDCEALCAGSGLVCDDSFFKGGGISVGGYAVECTKRPNQSAAGNACGCSQASNIGYIYAGSDRCATGPFVTVKADTDCSAFSTETDHQLWTSYKLNGLCKEANNTSYKGICEIITGAL